MSVQCGFGHIKKINKKKINTNREHVSRVLVT